MNDAILEVKNLKKIFYRKKRKKVAVDHVDIWMKKGECLGIIGESGSGKSTMAHLIAGLLQATCGEISFYGQHMQMIFQNPVNSFSPRMRILDSVCEGLKYQKSLSKNEIRERAYEALEFVNLGRNYANRYRNELSGGECQRVAIARAILIQPDLLICDEVTSALDVSVQSQIIKLLHKLKKEMGMSYLFISHDIALVSSISDRVAVMYNGRIIEVGKTMDVIENPQEEYTKLLIQSVPAF